MKMNERQLCRYIEEWTAAHYTEWANFQHSVIETKRTGIYTIEGGSQLMLIIDSIVGNMENYFGLEKGQHLMPSNFSSPRQLMRFLAWFRDYAEHGLEFIRKLPVEDQEKWEVQDTYRMLDHVYELSDCCIEAYSNSFLEESYVLLCKKMKECLEKEDVEGFIYVLKSIYASIPVLVHKGDIDEAYFHVIAHTVLYQLGFRMCSELSNNVGRLDLLVELKQKVYILEFKYTATEEDRCEEALKQIKDKKYAEPYLAKDKKVIAIGLTCGREARNIISHKKELLKKE